MLYLNKFKYTWFMLGLSAFLIIIWGCELLCANEYEDEGELRISYWFDDNIDISIDYADMDYQKLMDKRFEGAKLSSEDGDIHVFDISDCKNSDDKQYAVCIADNDQSSVIICGNDLDELNEMAKTVKFK